MEISHTRMNDLLCPFRLQALYTRGTKEIDDDDALMGIIGHAAAAKYGFKLWKAKQFQHLPLYMSILTAELKRYPQIAFSPHMADQVIEVGQNFAGHWSLDKDADDHQFEQRLFVGRDYIPFYPTLYDDRHEITKVLPADSIAGTPDHVTLLRHGTRARVEDYKMGFRMFDFDEAQHNDQLLLYAWLLWRNMPSLEEIVIILHAPMFNQRSEAAFATNLLPALVEPRIEAAWAKIDSLKAEYALSDWPAEANWNVCKWCKLTCPKYQQYLEALNGKSA